MSLNRLTLTFSTPLNYNNISLSDLMLSNEANAGSPSYVSISLTVSSTISSFSLNAIIIQLSEEDANRIKQLPPLCTVIDYCLLSLTSSFGSDTIGINAALSALLPASSVISSSFTPDITPPLLLSFSLDLNNAILSLQFSKTVNSFTLNSSAIVFSDGVSNVTCSRFVYVPYSTTPAPFNNFLSLILPLTTFLSIKSTLTLYPEGSNVSQLQMITTSALIQDMSGNVLTPVSSSLPLFVNDLIADTTPPILLAMSYNSSTMLLDAFFNDAMNLTALNLPELLVFGPRSDISASLNGANLLSSPLSTFPSMISLQLSPINYAISFIQFGTSPQFLAFLYLSGAGDVRDVSGNSNLVMTSSEAVGNGNSVYSFRLDLNQNLLIFEMVIPINDISSWVVSPQNIVLHDAMGNVLSLSGMGSVFTDEASGTFLMLQMTPYDAVTLTSTLQVTGNISVSIDQAFITNPNGMVGLAQAFSSLQAVEIVFPTTPPSLISFGLDLNKGLLFLYFSEPLLVASASLSALFLISSRNSSSATIISLSSASIVLNEAPFTSGVMEGPLLSQTLTLSLFNSSYLVPTDFPNLRDTLYLSHSQIGASVATTFLTTTFGLLSDNSIPKLYLPPIPPSRALQAIFLTPDTTPPLLLFFDLNMDLLQLTLKFSEAVTCYRVNLITLLSLNAMGAVSYTLTSSSTAFGIGTTTFVNISSSDFTNIIYLAPNLATEADNTYLTLAQNAFVDISYAANAVAAMSPQSAIRVRNYLKVSTPPSLLFYEASLQPTNPFLKLSFDKIVNCTSFNVASIILQSAAFIGSLASQYTLLPFSSQVNCPSPILTTVITVSLSDEDENNLLALPTVFKTVSTSFLRASSSLVLDPYGNAFLAIKDGNAIQPVTFQSDNVAPILSYFTIFSSYLLSLHFSEPIDFSQLVDVTKIILYNGGNGNFTYSYRLTSQSSVVATNISSVTIDMQLDALLIAEYSGKCSLVVFLYLYLKCLQEECQSLTLKATRTLLLTRTS